MRTNEATRARVPIAVIVSVGAMLLSSAAPAAAEAAPPRNPTQFACPLDSSNPFTDIAGSVHEANIRCAAAYGFINGTTRTTFAPSSAVTRGQVASFMARAVAFSGFPLDTADQGFTDIADSVHKEAINGLAALGVLNGTTPTTFSPNQAVTRGQIASMFARLFAVAIPPQDEPPDAFDDDNGSVHEPGINYLAAHGIVGGVTSDRYDPNGTLSRGAAASILARAQDYAVEEGVSNPLGTPEVIRASMTGAQEVPGPGDPDAQGTVEIVRFRVSGLLCVNLDFDGALNGAPTEVQVHEGTPTQAGPDVLTIPPPPSGSGFNGGCFPGFDATTVDDVFANPSAFYVNVHTADFPDGAIRGQLSRPVTTLASGLSGAEVAPGPGETDGSGGVSLDLMADGTTICAFATYDGGEAPMAAHIHKGALGASGPIVVTLPPFDDVFSDGCIAGGNPALVADLAANPEDYYVDIHTDNHPNGAVRGQLEEAFDVGTALSGAEEAPGPGDADGAGDATISLIGDDQICATIHVRGTSKPTAAHIHRGADGVAGPIVTTLLTPTFNSSGGCMDIDPALYDEIAASPASFYVDVDTGDFPTGAVRGQLARVSQPAAASSLESARAAQPLTAQKLRYASR